MTSSSLSVDKRRRVYVRLLGDIQHALNQALEEEHKKRGLTRAEIARILDCDKGFVTKKLSGVTNMTLETLADFSFALGRRVAVQLKCDAALPGSNHEALAVDQQPRTDPSSAEPVDGKKLLAMAAAS